MQDIRPIIQVILLKLLVMGVMDRVRSSRRLARNARENVVYLYLSEKLSPDFRTISDFRKDNPALVKEVFKHTVSFARQEGLLDLSHLSTDGSKVKANASNRRVMNKDELRVLLKFVDDELEEWARQDTREDSEFGDLRGSDQLPKQSKKTIRKAAQYYIKKVRERGPAFKEEVRNSLQEAKQEVEEQGLNKVSITDPESRFMKNKKGRIELSYNPQITVDKEGFIIANDITQSPVDTGQLQPQVLQTEENLGGLPERVAWSFDAAYFEGANIRFLADKKIDGYIPDSNEKKEADPFDKKHFQYDAIRDGYRCPENHPMSFLGAHFDKQKNKTIRIYKGNSMPCLPEPEQMYEAEGWNTISQDVSMGDREKRHGGEDEDAASKRGIQATTANRRTGHRRHQGESRTAGISNQRDSRGKDRVQSGLCSKESKENLVMSPEERR